MARKRKSANATKRDKLPDSGGYTEEIESVDLDDKGKVVHGEKKKRSIFFGEAAKTASKADATHKKSFFSRRIIFILGAIIGIGFALYFGSTQDVVSDWDKLVNLESVNDYFEDWKEVLPTSMQAMLSDAEGNQLHGSTESFSAGKVARDRGLTAKYNIAMVPGVITTGLESWGIQGTPDCPSEAHFRKRLWGSFYMLRTMILDKACWLEHIMLDPITGLDPPNITLRAAQGFDAADFFVSGYWIWNKILQNLAVIGYGPNNMISASYDWRLAYLDIEKRDAYFSKLKLQIEVQNKANKNRSVLLGHSMGSQIVFYFMKWVEAEGEYYGNGGPHWVNDNIEAVIDVSGSTLGTPKAITALLSGEMKDTVQLNALAGYGLEKFFSRRERLDLIHTFGGIPSMLPKGGNLIWGDHSGAPDDEESEGEVTKGLFIRFDNDRGNYSSKNLTLEESIPFVLEQSPEWFRARVKENYSFGIARTAKELAKNNNDHSKWSNPLEAALPNAPDTKIFCFYGVGNPTERSYTYEEVADKDAFKMNVIIDRDASKPVYFGDGDGTVSLMSHAMCHEWKKGKASRYNPGGSPVTIVEILHEPDRFDIRGGAKTAEHVDILGSAELNELILNVTAGTGGEIKDYYVSRLKDIVASLDI